VAEGHDDLDDAGEEGPSSRLLTCSAVKPYGLSKRNIFCVKHIAA